MTPTIASLIEYLRAEADFNRSWVDGRRNANLDHESTAEYKARRVELAAEREAWATLIARMQPVYDAAKALCVEWFDTSGSMSQIDAIQDRAREVAMAAFKAMTEEQP